jgi:hypothetical protein
MAQKILNFIKSKYFVFNAVIITVCFLAAVTVPQIVRNINMNYSAADTQEQDAATDDGSGQDGVDSGGSGAVTQELGEVTSEPIPQTDPETRKEQVLKLRAVFFELAWGDKYWEITLLDGNGGIIKSWAEIFAEYNADPNILQISGSNFTVESIGIKRTAGVMGVYAVTVTFSGLSVVLSKTETTF